MWVKQKQFGFTIVELLIVVIVIAIIAAVSIVAFSGIQQRARDSSIDAIANQIQKSLHLWYSETGVLPAAGWGSTGAATNNACPGTTTSSGGWFQSGTYLCTMHDLLKARGYLKEDITSRLPKNRVTNDNSTVFMFYNCGGTNQYVLMWSQESPSAADTANYTSNVTACGLSAASFTSTYGMRASALITF